MFPTSRNTPNTRVSTQRVVPSGVLEHNERYGLSDEAFTKASMDPEVRRQYVLEQDSKLSSVGNTGWLDDLNKLEINDQLVAKEKLHEPTDAEQASRAAVEMIRVATPYIVAVRRSPYAASKLLGMKPKDFDLAA